MDIDNCSFHKLFVVISQQNIPLDSVKFPLNGGELDDRRGIRGSHQGTQKATQDLPRETCRDKQSRSEFHFTSGMWSQAAFLGHDFSTRKSVQSFSFKNPVIG
jgi:hypothetical protein